MKKEEIFILGVGNNTIVFIDLVEACGYKVAGLYHYNNDRVGEKIHDYPILDSNENLFRNKYLGGKSFAISVGDNNIRVLLAENIRKRGGQLPTLIHPSASVSRFAKLEPGVIVHVNSVVQADAVIGKDTILSYNSSVTHTSTIKNGCYIAAHAHIGAYVDIDDKVMIGQGAIIVSSKVKSIGMNSIIGAGSVVLSNVPANTVYAGNPAKLLYNIER